MRRLLKLTLILLAAVVMAGCGKEQAKVAAKPVSAKAIGPAECAACGMVVREQPAPRGQLVHRDGTHVFFCSLGDMVQYIQAPSPHGKATHVYVETLDTKVDPEKPEMGARPWILAGKAHYLLGAKRRGIMGPPVLSFGNQADADAVKKRLDSAAIVSLDWAGLPPAVLKAAQRPNAH
ncbi:MAG: nitrous oxide reductase accessory protein NosL [Myxococcales bacterium]|nr:nitrous oxide reductase accessory protein NosL [Myxococcales bacterium]